MGRYARTGAYKAIHPQYNRALVSKIDLGLQQFVGGFSVSYRLIHGPHGWLDLLRGFRYTYLGTQVSLQANDMAINAASTQLVDQFANQLVTPGSGLRTLVQQDIVDRLTSLEVHNGPLPVGPIASAEPGQIRNAVQQLIQTQNPELVDAIRTGVQAKVAQLKTALANQVAVLLKSRLNRSFSFYDDWFDPLIGLRGRYNLSKAFYLTAETDVGGFGDWIGYCLAGICRTGLSNYSSYLLGGWLPGTL